MSSLWADMASLLSKRPEEIEAEAASAWVFSELSAVDHAVGEYVRGYGVASPDELIDLIRDGRVKGHPAWEDSIDWSNLLGYRNKVLKGITLLRDAARDHSK